ncbi:RecQ family ATP-dependent DNA helicase [Rufibacter hautae]|uniref:DNA 3'-5' helicase n=1 Tax=Rufibacter hautae TaxID=2595005 RepID=A0A5B6TCR2_9BACT|nr:RecQ family ATP-dependent DNA helicase [Rufibacter hautae]KAA3437671.1 RecQ family ATP-dependent DNA helicase [Rufibacter hautae]
MEHIAFFDLEVSTSPKQRIQSIGVWLKGNSWHGTSINDFEKFQEDSQFLCGHNILAHDLPYLTSAGASISLLEKPVIDTLYLSPLFFPDRPYHRLIKDYRLVSDYFNNPVEDSKIAADLLEDCILAYYSLPPTLKKILYNLLCREKAFSAFFNLLEESMPEVVIDSLEDNIKSFFYNRICSTVSLYPLIHEQRVPLAYALVLLNAPDQGSIIPPWLLHRFPEIVNVLQLLRGTSCHQFACNYCESFLSPVAGLRKYFGYEGFRKFTPTEQTPLQQQVVEAGLKGESLLAIFPTGGGKSLTFQLPALMKGEANRALTVVISPLQALMKDQVDVLRNRFDITTAIAINGLLSPLERADAIQRVQDGGANLLYISPESLRSNTIYKLLQGRQIERFVIDEAHCFSSWGQDFRVDYLYVGRFLKELTLAKNLQQPIPVSCFTATAKPEVVQDIITYFKEEADLDLNLYQTTASRTNLTYNASKTEGKEAKLQQLKDLLEHTIEPAIVYVSRTKTAEYVAEELKKANIKAAAFHGRMESDLKIRIQDSFMAGETNVIVATSAFGMGVDKENVKLVVHYDISDSLENYIQEAGRAGRNPSMEANCHLLFDENDLNDHFALLNQTKLSKKEVGQIWKAVKDFKRLKFTKSALELAKQAGWDTDIMNLETQVKAAIAALEDVGYLKREMNSPRIFAQSILVRNVEAANKVINANPDKFPGDQLQQAIRIFQYLISREDTLVDTLSDHLGIEKENVVNILLHFKELGLLGDTKDLTALINPTRSEKNSERCFQRYAIIEKALLDILAPSEEAPTVLQTHLRDLNEKLIEKRCNGSSIEAIRNLLQFWEHKHYIKKERIDAHTLLYRIGFRKDKQEIKKAIDDRLTRATDVVKWLCEQNVLEIANRKKQEDAALEFSMVEMKKQVEVKNITLAKASLTEYEADLLYLHTIGSIKLEGGLFVLYNPMSIERLIEDTRKQYTNEDYKKLERHYEKKVEQIHIIGEYAKKQLRNHIEALGFVNDYFNLGYEAFVQRHFRHEKGKLKQPITEKKYREIFGALSSDQTQVIKDNKSLNILVGAGPGSGKTRVLVHKVAALLMMEDIKPEQFLMLTFSRPAATEFKERLHKLIGKSAYHIDIYTYHGFAFQLLGRVGDLKKSDNVIKQATESLANDDIPSDRLKCKSVIVVDEYQDISQQEYDFLNKIIELADEVRVIVVGDDDQNIYEFRGSSIAFMRDFERDQKATKYLFSINYRACYNLVEFSNQFLRLFKSDRLKAGLPLVAQNQTYGSICLIRYLPASDLIHPLVQDVMKQRLSGTTAVLTHTNEEALLVQNLLLQNDVPSRLIMAQDGFSLRQLLEIKCFSWYIHDKISSDLGYIAKEDWYKSKNRIAKEFANSVNLTLAIDVITEFERNFGGRTFWSDWLVFLQEARTEDFVFPEQNTVLVSTMHKAKGKEFDHVFIMLRNFPLHDEACKRVIYVAITRAKKNLYIHTDQPYFDNIFVPELSKVADHTIYPSPSDLQLELGMKDVWLSFFKRPTSISAIKPLRSGNELRIPLDYSVGLMSLAEVLYTGEQVVAYSVKFKERIEKLRQQGYKLHKAVIAHIVVWYCEDERKEYRIVLPRLFWQSDKSAIIDNYIS